jgi:alkaline phosphatase D
MNMTIARSIIAAAALSGAAACVSATPNAPIASAERLDGAQEALRPYYAELARNTDLPSISTPELAADTLITRIAVGSCNNQFRSQDIWQTIAASNPQAMLMIGDNVYADTGFKGEGDLASFVANYRAQAQHREFTDFAARVPVMATWDDHDYGPNDSGGSFFGKAYSETIFESFWASSDDVRSRPGVYFSRTYGAEGQRVQLIVLDTRYFRDDLVAKPYSASGYPLGNYQPSADPSADVLGENQSRWLADQLAQPADLRIVVSSIQVITDAHDFESWENFPAARERLYSALSARNGGGLVMLSGDRHAGAIYRHSPPALGEHLWELTASSLNMAFPRDDASERELDPRRSTEMISQENFGLVDIDWAQRAVTLRLLSDEGTEFASRTFGF